MTAPSFFSSYGLCVTLLDRTGVTFRKNLSQYVTAYSHTIDAVGGFGAASITLTMMMWEAMYLFEQLIAGRIKVTCDAGRIVYEGSINSVSINAGSESDTIGALFDIGNRVSVIYTPTDYTVYPPVAGSQVRSPLVDDADSQALYGIIEKELSMGQTTEVVALQARDVFMREAANPNRSGGLSVSPGGGQQVSLSLECVGIKDWFAAYVYNNYTAGVTDVATKIIAIISADPNGYIYKGASTDFTRIAANALLTPTEETKDRFAWDILTELLALGNDTTDDRRNFGVYENQLCIYETIPTIITYRHMLTDPKQCIVDNQAPGVIVPPWLVRPGCFLIVPDFITSGIPDTSTFLKKDPRIKFLESVTYNAPLSVDLSGGKTDKLSQMLAKITYSGGLY